MTLLRVMKKPRLLLPPLIFAVCFLTAILSQLLVVDSVAALPEAVAGRVMLSSSKATSSSSAISDVAVAAADLQQFLSEKGYDSVSNSASSDLAVIDETTAVDSSPDTSGSSSTGSSSSSSSTSSSSSSSSSSSVGVGAVGFNVVLGAPAADGGGLGRKMLQTSNDVNYINTFLFELAEALGVPRTALTATSFTGSACIMS
jgi:hypothetical protein